MAHFGLLARVRQMGTVGAIRERDVRGRFTGRPSPYQGSRPGANVAGPVGLTMDTALAAQPASNKYATSFPTNHNINYARLVPSVSESKFKELVDGGLSKDVHHKGCLSFVVRDWSFITHGKAQNHTARNYYEHMCEIVSLAGLNAILYFQQKQRADAHRERGDAGSEDIISPEHVINAVNFDGVIRNEVGEQVEDVYMDRVENGLAQASMFNTTVRGRVPTQNVWGPHLKGNQMVYLVVKTVMMDATEEAAHGDSTTKRLVMHGYRTDPNGLSTPALISAHRNQEVAECVQVLPWIAADGSDSPPSVQDVGKGGYYIAVGRCSDRKRYAAANEHAGKWGWFDARYAITAPLVELHVETSNPPITYSRPFPGVENTKNTFLRIALTGEI